MKKSYKKDKEAFFREEKTEAEETAKKNYSKMIFKIVKELTGVNSKNNSVPIKDKESKVLSLEEDQIKDG